MTTIRESIRKFFTTHKPLPAGTYQYQAPAEAEHPYRLHLRIEPDGQGLLIINASTVLHLNQTAAEYAYHLVKNTPPEEVARSIATRYHVGQEQALTDYQDLTGRIDTLITTPDLDPVTYLDFDRRDPYTTEISAPYRMDLALTYRLPANEDPRYAPTERVKQELTTAEWKTILSKVWDAGVPQVIFTGGEPTMRDDLVDLIAYTQEIGQVSGLLTDGLRLADPAYLQSLLQSGLDHIMFLLQPENEASWAALEKVLAEDIFTTVHLTLTPENASQLLLSMDRLSQMGATNISLSASDSALTQSLQDTHKAAIERGMSLVWDLPVPYSSFNPVAFERPENVPDGAGRAWLYVEPDGDVLLTQGANPVLGNLLGDDWQTIWQARQL